MGSEKIPIPLPASSPALSSRARTLKRLGLAIAVTTVWLLVHHFVRCAQHKATPEELELAAAFSWRPPTHGKRPLFGRRAIKEFLTVPNNESAIAASRLYATKPHIAGSPQDLVTAIDVLTLFQQEFGLPPSKSPPIFQAGSPASRLATLTLPWTSRPRAWIDTYYPVLNTPLDRDLEILDNDGKVVWKADLEENADDTDPEAGQYWAAVPTFHGLSKKGDVSGPLIYANYGQLEDYQDLEAKGVNFTGAVVLVRYGRLFRGLKIKGAEERGAVGVIIYSDTRDDGGVTVENGYEAYPNGPARAPTSVQRGSVQHISTYPGDPTTPGYPSYANSTRMEPRSIPKIPSLPVSWENGQRLLKELPKNGFKSSSIVRLNNNVDDKVTPNWNTMAVIPGHIKDEILLIGNHRDAWVMGATDPSSGTASMHEVIRGFGHLYRKGWRPLRSIVFASWDAEEYGLVGSTEYGEDFRNFLSKHVVAYLNLDSSVSGSRFHVSGSPSLAHLLRRVAEHIPHPTDEGRSLWSARTDEGQFKNDFVAPETLEWEAKEAKLVADTGVGPLGSGSDFTVFLQHIGIASSDGGFGAGPGEACYHYHSVWDSQMWQEKYADPGFHRHVAVSKFLGTVALTIADSVVLPINTTQYAVELDSYLKRVEDITSSLDAKPDLSDLKKAISKLQEASIKFDSEKVAAEKALKKLLRKGHKRRRLMRKLKCKLKRLTAWVKTRVFRVPATPYVHHKEREEEHDELPEWIAAQGTEQIPGERGPCMLASAPAGMPQTKPRVPHRNPLKLIRAVRRVRVANRKLAAFERGFISAEGIMQREWYRHLVVAPGRWLGYGATTFPALTESLTLEKNSTMAQREAERLVKLLTKSAQAFGV